MTPKQAAIACAALALVALLLLVMQTRQVSSAVAAGENEQAKITARQCRLMSSQNNPNTYTSSCGGTYPAGCGAGNDLASCNDGSFEAPTASNGKYRGINITAFNTSIICGSITSVRICYEWWATVGDTQANCRISVDANAGASWSDASTACPGTSADPGITCTDVTALEAWSCGVFFGPSVTGAYARAEGQRTSSGAATAVNIDALYFNITYTTPPVNNTVLKPPQGYNASGNFLVNASVNSTAAITMANLTIYNSTGNVTWLMPMSLGAGTATTGWWNITVNSALFPDGFYNLTVNATNLGETINISGNISITMDNSFPNVSIILPLNSTNISRTFAVNASVNDSPTKVSNVSFRLANRTAATEWSYAWLNSGTTDQGYWNATFNSASVADGLYNITVNATDYAGNQLLANISQIKIDNIEPVIRRVLLPDSVYLNPGSESLVSCNATIEDDNGPANVHRVNATLYDSLLSFNSADDNNNHYTNSSCAAIAEGATNNQQNYTCGFSLLYYANNASWTCNVTATASINMTNSTTNLTLVNELLALGVNATAIDYGNISVTQTSGEHALNISNQGNVPINVTVKGFGWDNATLGNNMAMMCEAGNISVGYQRYSNVSGAGWQDMINLTSSPAKIMNFTLWQRQNDLSIGGNDSNVTYWRIRVPLGVGGLCNGTIQFAATVE